jgi:hypothetical protein
MKKNVGSIDKMIRLVIAAVLAILIIAGIITGVWATIAGVIAFAMVITSLFGFCGLYKLFGITTCPMKTE